MTISLGLIDYGMGNLHSVYEAFKRLNQKVQIIKNPKDLISCNALILPGVGSFDPAIDNLKRTELVPDIKRWVSDGKPLLGICLGLQLLFEYSEEGNSKGLSLLKGSIKRLPSNQNERIPHMGWSLLEKTNDCPLLNKNESSNWVYFVHSYSAIPTNKNDLAASVKFGESSISAIVWKDNFGACQFHPEKSGKIGQKMLLNWINWLEKESSISL